MLFIIIIIIINYVDDLLNKLNVSNGRHRHASKRKWIFH